MSQLKRSATPLNINHREHPRPSPTAASAPFICSGPIPTQSRAVAPSAGGGPPRMAQGPAWAFRSPAPESWAAAPSPMRSPAPISAAGVAIAPGLHEVRLVDPPSETRRPPSLPPSMPLLQRDPLARPNRAAVPTLSQRDRDKSNCQTLTRHPPSPRATAPENGSTPPCLRW